MKINLMSSNGNIMVMERPRRRFRHFRRQAFPIGTLAALALLPYIAPPPYPYYPYY